MDTATNSWGTMTGRGAGRPSASARAKASTIEREVGARVAEEVLDAAVVKELEVHLGGGLSAQCPGGHEHSPRAAMWSSHEPSRRGSDYRPQSRRVARRAPSARAANFSHATLSCVSLKRTADAANPQSAPAMTFSRPTRLANRWIRSAISSGCSTRLVVWLMTPGMRILPSGSLHVLEDVVLVLVPRVRRLERVRAGIDLQHDVDDVLQFHLVDARAHVDAVAGVEPDLVRRDAAERVVDRLDALGRPLPAVLHALVRIHHVVRDQARIVDLKDEAGVHDGLVLLAERVGDGLLVLVSVR